MIESIRQQIKAEIVKLTTAYEALGGISITNSTKPLRTMSKAARAKIAAAQRKRWAKQRKAA
jgi:hypothetical protein